MARAKTVEEKMDMYPVEMWDILAAICKGESWSKSFDTHAEACRFIGRFYNFRYDAVAAKQPGALNLRDVYVTGRDANGQVFHTRRTMAPGPIGVDFLYRGPGNNLQSMVDVPGLDEPEQAPEIKPQVDAGEEAVKAWLRGEGGTAQVTSQGSECKHELNELSGSCIHCGKPEEEWEKQQGAGQ